MQDRWVDRSYPQKTPKQWSKKKMLWSRSRRSKVKPDVESQWKHGGEVEKKRGTTKKVMKTNGSEQGSLERLAGDFFSFLHKKPSVVSQMSHGGSRLNHVQLCSWFSAYVDVLQYRQSLSELKHRFFQARTHSDVFGIKLTSFIQDIRLHIDPLCSSDSFCNKYTF